MTKHNPHIGGTLEDFLKEDGLEADVTATAIKRTIVRRNEYGVGEITMARWGMPSPTFALKGKRWKAS